MGICNGITITDKGFLRVKGEVMVMKEFNAPFCTERIEFFLIGGHKRESE